MERIAARQLGVFSRGQALSAGITSGQLRHRVERGAWRRLAPGVFGFPGHTDSHRRRCWVALLHAGDDACLSHGTAGLLLGMAPIEGEPVDVTVARGRSRALEGTRRHRPRQWDPARVRYVDGLPVTDPARTIVDLASELRGPRLERLVEHAEVERICPVVAVGAELGHVRRRGVPGVRRLESVLDQLGPGDALPRSELERLGDQVRRLAGLPEPVHEHPLPSVSGQVGFVDRAWREAMLIVEFDGRRWHTRRHQVHKDAQRDLEAAALGWHTQRLIWEMLRHDPEGTAELLAATYARRCALLGRGVRT